MVPTVYLKLKEMILKRVYLNYQRLQHMFANCLQYIEAVTNVINVASNLGSSDNFSKQLGDSTLAQFSWKTSPETPSFQSSKGMESVGAMKLRE
jgi:hypothetical protein